jgi:hypothetical protein
MNDLLVLERNDGDAGYLTEILEHAGLVFEKRRASEAGQLANSLVVTVGAALRSETADLLARHVADGGGLLCLGGHAGLEGVLGIVDTRVSGEGWLNIATSAHPVTNGLRTPLHVFGGVIATLRGATELLSLNGGAAVTWHRFGKGFAVFVGAEIAGAVMHIQQGTYIASDGEPASDGTAPLNDGILKSEDGLVLDWERDRQTVHVPRGRFPGAWGGGTKIPDSIPGPDEPMPFRLFEEPVADNLREVLLRCVYGVASACGIALKQVWYWQRGLPAVGHLSHDSDGNDPELAERLRVVCKELDAPTTWCILYPGGYAPAFYRRLLDDGFEIASHYDAVTGDARRTWSYENFAVQMQWLRDMAGPKDIRSNKNHYLRWEGRLDFYRWCESEGIVADGTKGPSKTGDVGFPFGTCHPWFPHDDEGDGRRLDVLEIPLMTQDLVVTAPEVYAEVLTDAARRHHGVAHFLFHPAHIAKDGVAEAMRRLVGYARDAGMEWWTSARIREWEDARRRIRWVDNTVSAPSRTEDVTLMRLLSPGATIPNGWEPVERYGFRFAQTTRTIEGSCEL